MIPLAAFGMYHVVKAVMRAAGPVTSSITRSATSLSQPAAAAETQTVFSETSTTPPVNPAAVRASGNKRIALILDDVGFGGQPLAEATRIDPNLSFAIIPGEAHSRESARTLSAGGFEILCHLPMEPVGYPAVSPGKRAVLNAMSDEEIRARVRDSFDLLPEARGFNNHMGSRGTADRRVMEQVFAAMPPGLFFVDSRTTSSSVAGRIARERKIRTTSRDVFLDDQQDEQSIRKQLTALAALSDKGEIAVGIGHMYPSTIKVLSQELPKLRERGFRFIRASEAVN
ncbi:MAG TPA: divergent polysaccharide deacetylase family protein [Thermoanaerobaculia bacterium]|nr:divergent polysaccharide deacetylase family protein [Thermoanaerobaculia bacterium]